MISFVCEPENENKQKMAHNGNECKWLEANR